MCHTPAGTCVCVLIYPVTAGAIYYLTTDQDQQDQPTTPQRSFSSALFSIYRTKNLLKRLLATPATPTHTVHLAITLYVARAGIFCTLHHILLYETLTFPSHFFFLCVSDISEVSAHTFQGVATSHSASPCLLQARLLLLK